jgi:hypothetical protein
MTMTHTIYFGSFDILWLHSFITGVATFTRPAEELNEAIGAIYLNGNLLVKEGQESNGLLLSHEIIHHLQYIRGDAFFDPLLRQNVSQKRPLEFVRLDFGRVAHWTPVYIHEFLASPYTWETFPEWEALWYVY